jgi:hypothetical protein
MAHRCRSGIAWVCALVLLLQAAAAALAIGRAAAAQLDPLSRIPICGGQTAAGKDHAPAAPSGDHRDQHCFGECCLAGCCPGPLAAVLPQLRDMAIPAPALADNVWWPAPVAPVVKQADGPFKARAPPLSL